MKNALLDGKNLFIHWDVGFVEGRQYKGPSNYYDNIKKSMMIYPSN